MKREYISSGSSFEQKIGYSRAVVDGDFLFLSGTTGFDYDKMTISDDIVEQTEQCFKNIQEAIDKAGFELSDIVRVLYILPEATEFEKCWPTLRKHLASVKPAATMISAGLADIRMKIEIEVTAKKSK